MCLVFWFPPSNQSTRLSSENSLVPRMWRVTSDRLHTILGGKPPESLPQIPDLHPEGMEHSTKVSFPCTWVSTCQNPKEMKQKQFPKSSLTSPFSLSYASYMEKIVWVNGICGSIRPFSYRISAGEARVCPLLLPSSAGCHFLQIILSFIIKCKSFVKAMVLRPFLLLNELPGVSGISEVSRNLTFN